MNVSIPSDNINDYDKKPQSKTHKQKNFTYDNPSNKDNESSSSDSKNDSDEKAIHKHEN